MLGIDVYQGDGKRGKYPLKQVPMKAFSESDFVIVKATQGISYGHEDFFEKTMQAAIKAKKLVGCYHYAAGNDPVDEAKFFLKRVKKYIGKAVLALDWERIQNKAWGDKTWCKKFLSYVKKETGISCLLYTGIDGIKQNAGIANQYPLWFAGYPNPSYSGWKVPAFKYNVSPWKSFLIWQYTSSGEKVDRNTTSMTREAWMDLASVKMNISTKTESDVRKSVINAISKYKGIKECGETHKYLINVFNNSGLCKRYKMTTKDAWCAMTVSDAFILTSLAGKPGSGALFQCVECSCNKMIDLGKKQGIWTEKDDYVPKIGDVIFYDWQDPGSGDNKGTPDHVGLVASCDGKTITVLEGNYKNSIGERTIKVNGKNIRGFICPKYKLYSSEDKPEEKKKPEGKLYSGKFPSLPPRGFFQFGDGYLQYRPWATQIRRLQKLVNWIAGTNIKIDGDYGKATIDAVKKAQKLLGVKEDGLFGATTLAKARSYKK